jgi:selenocysteine-specific elongation factor
LKEVVERARLEEGEIAPALAELLGRGELVVLSGNPEQDREALVVARAGYMRLASTLTQTLGEYHAAYPLRALMPREELRSRLGLSQKELGALIARAEEENLVVDAARGLRLPGHEPRFTPEQTRAVQALLAAFARDPHNTPSVKQCQESLGEETYTALLEQERLRQVSAEVVFLRETYEAMVARIRATLQERGTLTVAEARDTFATSRKYVLALLEHLDAAGITVRVGDERKLRAAPK